MVLSKQRVGSSCNLLGLWSFGPKVFLGGPLEGDVVRNVRVWCVAVPRNHPNALGGRCTGVFAIPAQQVPLLFNDVVAFFPISLGHHANLGNVLFEFGLRFLSVYLQKLPNVAKWAHG